MNPALLFLVIIAAITVVVLWVVLRPLLAKPVSTPRAATGDGQSNVDALRIELAEARRDQKLGLLSDASLAEAERELETRVLAESQLTTHPTAPRYKGTAISLAVFLPVLAVAGYAAVGSPAAVVPALAQSAPTAQPTESSQADVQMNELFKLAEERLNKEPNDVKGWLLLARAKASVGMFDGAIKAYQNAAKLNPNDSEMWSDYADSAAGMAQGQMDGQPIEFINKALALDGKNIKALLLRGTWQIQKNELVAAEKSFTLAQSLSEPNSGFAQIADNALGEIKSRQGAAPPTATAAQPTTATAAAAPLANVTLQLSAEARKALMASPANAAVFLIVRAANADRGPPLAAKKVALADIEKPIVVTATDAMIGGAGLAPGADVVMQARLSLTGQPMAQTGDWQSAKVAAKLPSAALQLIIDQPVQN
jgi:cytochrome c-type biogenesis protein CcmH